MKKKHKQKLSSAGRKLAAEWDAICELHRSWPPFRRTSTPPYTLKPEVTAAGRYPAERRIATFVPDTGTAVKPNVYTGDKLIGISVMHKSNLVPVFTEGEAKDLAKMRRG